MIERVLGPLRKAGLCRINRSERTVEFPNGGFLAMYSMDNPDSIRGENFHLIIVDEAAMISEEAWTDCIQPTLADNDGDCVLISTPKGRNWFWKEFQSAKKHAAEGGLRYHCWTATSRSNPNPNIQAAFDRVKEKVSERTYRQEWCAEFLEDGGEVFRGVALVSKAQKREPYIGTFVMSADWGKSNDFTSLKVMDIHTRRVVDWDRYNTVGWSLQRGRLRAMHDRWPARSCSPKRTRLETPTSKFCSKKVCRFWVSTPTAPAKRRSLSRMRCPSNAATSKRPIMES